MTHRWNERAKIPKLSVVCSSRMGWVLVMWLSLEPLGSLGIFLCSQCQPAKASEMKHWTNVPPFLGKAALEQTQMLIPRTCQCLWINDYAHIHGMSACFWYFCCVCIHLHCTERPAVYRSSSDCAISKLCVCGYVCNMRYVLNLYGHGCAVRATILVRRVSPNHRYACLMITHLWCRSRASPDKQWLPHGNFGRIFVVWTKWPCPGALSMPSYLVQRATVHEMQAIRVNYPD